MRRSGLAANRIVILAVIVVGVGIATAAFIAGPHSVSSAAPSSSSASAPQPSGAVGNLPLPLPRGGPARVDKADAAMQFLGPGQVTVPARRPAVINLRFRVADGLHINSHAPHDKYLVPARLAVAEGGGINVTQVDFPPGEDYALAFSPNHKLSVYTGEFILHARLTAAPGRRTLQAALRYQACDMNACRPPAALPITVMVIAK